MKTKIYTATFIGKTSLGYETGKTYEIFVQQQDLWKQFRRNWIIEIWRENSTGWCPYESIHSFLANWRIENFDLTEEPEGMIIKNILVWF